MPIAPSGALTGDPDPPAMPSLGADTPPPPVGEGDVAGDGVDAGGSVPLSGDGTGIGLI